MAVLGLRFCVRASSSCGKWGPLFIAVHGPPTIAASPVAEHRLQTRRLSNCGSRAQSLRGMWDPPRPGPEPVSPAPAGRLPTTAPPGKPSLIFFFKRKCENKKKQGFPGGAVVKNLPANAGDTGSSSGLGRSHMPRSDWAREPQLLSLRVWSLCSATREVAIVRGRDGERPAHRGEEWPPLSATGESPRTETKTQHSQK